MLYLIACDECARTKLVENDLNCPLCGEDDTSPEELIPDMQTRKQVATVLGQVNSAVSSE